MAKAVVLMSGGLDSILAAKLLQEQGIEVEAITFVTPFFTSKNAEKAAAMLGIPLHIVDITDEHLKMLKAPKHGYGRFMNPCIDCHALMIRRAGEIMKEVGADFIVTGEVLGERPKSQNRQALNVVEIESGMGGYVLRPLSAKLLDPTIPEKKGLVDREKLLDIRGRSRKPQMELAKKYGITEYPSPAGGCILTDPMFSIRLRNLYKVEEEPSAKDVDLIKIGRVFLSGEGALIVVSRNEQENKELISLAEEGDMIFEVDGYPGPLTIIPQNDFGEGTIFEAAALTVRYSKAKSALEADVLGWVHGTDKKITIHVDNPSEAVDIIPAKDDELTRVVRK
ncbi:MAG: 7-cyano-7-deazaguanine synthase [Actinobacteria bacterium]|nr:7-cyano-7-deazaguanine synthase [Actinomycetota bacterium]